MVEGGMTRSTIFLGVSLASALASQLQVPDQHGKPLLESLRSALAAAPKVLLLDGAERITAQVAELAGDLLTAGAHPPR